MCIRDRPRPGSGKMATNGWSLAGARLPHEQVPDLMRLLLVEDDRMIGSSLRAVLHAESHAVDWVRDLASARAACAAEHF